MAVTPPELSAIIARIKADVRAETGVDALRRSIEYALTRALGGQSRGQYGYIKYLFDQAWPDLADEAHFWRHAALRGIFQKPATGWVGTYQFSGANTTVVPAGAELARSDGALYATLAEVTIASGVATADIQAKSGYEGTAGNNDTAQTLQLSVPILGIDSEGTVQSTTTDGTDLETQEDGLVRYLLDVRNPTSNGGGSKDYERWALEVPGVTRAWESVIAPGQVAVAFVRDNDGSGTAILPDSGEREAVRAYVQAKAPITVTISVVTLTALVVDVTVENLIPDTSPVRAAIQLELQDFFAREAKPSSTLKLSRLDEAVSSAEGETSHDLTLPVAEVVSTSSQVPILGTVSFP